MGVSGRYLEAVFPKFADVEIQGWNQGMKLLKADPLPGAKSVGALWLMRVDGSELRLLVKNAQAPAWG